jgi:glycosyltransferase involved in cell wall biosynthesis
MRQPELTMRSPRSPATAVQSPRDSSGLKLAIVSPEVGPGAGVPSYWDALAVTLASDHEVHIFAAANRCDAPRIRSHHLPTLRMGWLLTHLTFYAAVRARFSLARLRGHPRFDIILGVGALTPCADIATVHFVQARELELQRNSAFPRERRLGGLAGLDYALYSRTMGWLGRRFYRKRSSHIVAISEAVKQDLVRFEGACADDISVVPNGVDIDRFDPANRALHRAAIRSELGLSDTNTAVLFVGNSWGRKGLHTAIEAIRGPEQEHLRLVVVGHGVRQEFLAGLPDDVVDRVIFTGPRATDIERLYAAADVFLFPTLYEPFGLVILEALASGLPTIVSASAGASEWLEDGVDAVLLRDPFDGIEARLALRSVITRPAFAQMLAVNGRRKAAELQWSAVATALIAAAPARLPPHALGKPA